MLSVYRRCLLLMLCLCMALPLLPDNSMYVAAFAEEGDADSDAVCIESTAGPSAEPTAAQDLEPSAEPTAEPTAETVAEYTAEPDADDIAGSAAETTVEPVSEPTAEPVIVLTVSCETPVTGKEFVVAFGGMGESAVYTYNLYFGDVIVDSGESHETAAFTLYESGVYLLRVTSGGIAADMEISVAPTAPSKITVRAEKIGVGEEYELVVIPEPWYAEAEYTYKTSASKYVRVDERGVVTGVRSGSAYITVKADNGRKSGVKVTVGKAPKSIELSAERTVLGAGETVSLSAKLPKGTSSAYRKIEIIDASAPDVIVIGGDGGITARNTGTATVRMTLFNGVSDEISFMVCPAPVSIEMPETACVSVNGNKVSVAAVLSEGSCGSVKYTSSDTSVAKVDENGVVKAVKAGKAIITAETYNGITASCDVTVLPAPKKLSLNQYTITVGVGDSFVLSGTVSPIEADGTLRFKSSSSKYATVDQNGVVTANKKGTVYIYAYTYNDKSARCKVIIKAAPEKVTLSAESICLGYDAALDMGESCTLKASLPKNTQTTLEWSVSAQSSEGVIILGQDGTVTAAGIGWAEVTVTTHNGKTDTCRVEVLPAPKEFELVSPLEVIGVGQTVKLNVVMDGCRSGSIKYTCEPSGIAQVDKDGNLKGKKPGTVTVTATAFNGCTAVAEIEVRPAPSNVRVPSRKVTLAAGETYDIGAYIPDGTVTLLTYSSSRKSVATVDGDGCVTALKAGTSTITVKTHNGKKTTVAVTVKAAPKSVAFKQDEIFLHPGETVNPGVSITKNSRTTYTYVSADEGIAGVAADGTVSATGLGETVITVTTHNGLSDTLVVRVVEPPYSIRYTGDENEIVAIGVNMPLPVEVLTESGRPYEGKLTVKSSSSSVLGVDGEGMTGKKRGTVTVTVSAGGLQVKFKVQVKRYNDVYDPAIISHRGNGSGYPENSLEGLMASINTGATLVEVDVRRTSDGVLVLCHDAAVDRMSNGKGNVCDMTYAELLELDFGGTRICTFEQAAAAVSGMDIIFMVEFKDEGIAADCVEIINSYGLGDRTLYGSFKLGELQTVRSLEPDADIAFIHGSNSWYTDKAIEIVLENDFDAIFCKYSSVSESSAAKIHSNGIKIGVYTVNKKTQYNTAIGAGVDYIASDKPNFIYDLEN